MIRYQFRHPARVVVAGPSMSGKTEFVKRVLENSDALFTTPPKRIIYTYKYRQAWFDSYVHFVEFVKEIPALHADEPSIVILDDILVDRNTMREAASLFVRGSHHLNCSVFLLSQNLYSDSSYYRTISLNASVFILFKSLRGQNQIQMLGRQIFGSSHEFISAYKDATKEPYGYLVLDLTQDHPLRTNIFPSDTEIVYVLEE